MRNRFDHVAKQIGQEALRPAGTTILNEEINPETQYADLRHEPDPARQAERARLGLLGRLASVACLIEIYSQAPNGEEFRACLAKHLALWQQRARKARSDNKKRNEHQPAEASGAPFLWIITAGVPATVLTKLKLERSPEWPVGIYLFGDDILRVGIVVASELPRDGTTLLVRLMAAGPLLALAIVELAALPAHAYERAVAEPVLLQLQHVLGHDPSRTPDEQEFIMAMLKSWEEGRAEARAEGRAAGRAEGRAAGHAEGHAAGHAEAHAEALFTVLQIRGIVVPDAARERILAQHDSEQLKRWLERAVVASSIGEVLGQTS